MIGALWLRTLSCMPKPLKVSITDIADAMSFQPSDGEGALYLDLDTGEVVSFMADELRGDDDPRESRPLRRVPRPDSHSEYRLMAAFVDELQDERLQERFRDAISGKGAFSRFKRLLSDFPDLRESWFRRRDAWLIDEAVDWLRRLDIEPIYELPRPPEAPPPPPPPKANKRAEIGLVDLLLLGGVASDAAREDGEIVRTYKAPSKKAAHGVFMSLVYEMVEWPAIDGPGGLSKDRNEFRLGRLLLRCRGSVVELTVSVDAAVREAFRKH